MRLGISQAADVHVPQSLSNILLSFFVAVVENHYKFSDLKQQSFYYLS